MGTLDARKMTDSDQQVVNYEMGQQQDFVGREIWKPEVYGLEPTFKLTNFTGLKG